MKASIFIPTKNAGPNFKKVLEAIYSQDEKDFEIVIVDSGSTDETLKIVRSFPQIRLYEIHPNEFGHGKTRNLATRYCKGELVVFLTQDVLPLNSKWLSELIIPHSKNRIAGTFSRQIPYPHSKITEEFFYHYHFPSIGHTKLSHLKKKFRNQMTLAHTFFSHASACVKKSILKKIPLREDLIMCEDQGWSKDVINAGFEIAYVSNSEVWHSHNYSFSETVERYFDSAYSFKMILNEAFKVQKTGSHYMIEELRYVIGNKPLALPVILFNNIAKIIGTFMGLHGEKLPKFIKKKISMHKYYWK